MKVLLLLLFISCSSVYRVDRSAYPNGKAVDAIYYARMIEFKDTCWVVDSTTFEWKLRCK
jgi:hypothetical protein